MRHEEAFPLGDGLQYEFLKKMWVEGWLDDFSEEHFLIKAINKTLTDFKYIDYYKNNMSFISIAGADYSTFDNMELFCETFIINFALRLEFLCTLFGENKIKNFVINQLSAGKNKYDENVFFQAVSEVSILEFMGSYLYVTESLYEPKAGKKNLGNDKKNPEASFKCSWCWTLDKKQNKIPGPIYKINIEVKTPMFHTPKNEMLCVPGTLLTDEGIQEIKDYCTSYGITYRNPGIGKLTDFIKSAINKFNYPEENELNLLYINWSQSDFPSNGYLEAWSLLTNPENGLLTNDWVLKLFGIDEHELEKISAIIVYTEDLEGFMLTDLRHTWKQDPEWGTRFRIWVHDTKLRIDNDIIFNLTHMNPTPFDYVPALISIKSTDKIMEEDKEKICVKLQDIIKKNRLSKNN